jgi:hypothetical protein
MSLSNAYEYVCEEIACKDVSVRNASKDMSVSNASEDMSERIASVR